MTLSTADILLTGRLIDRLRNRSAGSLKISLQVLSATQVLKHWLFARKRSTVPGVDAYGK